MLSEALLRARVEQTGPAEIVRARTWATTTRISTADGPVWFKVRAPMHAFEPQLVAELAGRWPALLPRVLAHDAAQGWLLLGDAGTSFDDLDNPPEQWEQLLPRYAELQRAAPILGGVPARRLERWPELFDELATSPLPLDADEVQRLRAYSLNFSELCHELATHGLPATIQHDDLHHKNAFVDGECLRIIDWGDACVSHPFVSLVVTFRFLEERSGLRAGDLWFARLRDAYLEPWGSRLVPAFELSQRIGRFAHAFGWVRLRRLLPEEVRSAYDVPFAVVLRRALAAMRATRSQRLGR